MSNNWKDKFPQENRYFETKNGMLFNGNVLEVLKQLPDNSVDTVVTSPPYWGLRDYEVEGQIGLEPTLDEYIENIFQVMKELKRIIKPTGIIFWNHGDSYGGSYSASYGGMSKDSFYGGELKHGRKRHKRIEKCLNLQNYRFIIKCIDELGLILRNTIIWRKTNAMPSSVRDRFTTVYEPVFMLVKNKKYWFDLDAIRVPHKTSIDEYKNKLPKSLTGKTNKTGGAGIIKYSTQEAIERRHALGKNPGDVWDISTQPFTAKKYGIENVDHFAAFPEKLVGVIIICL